MGGEGADNKVVFAIKTNLKNEKLQSRYIF